jgi:plastocyanin
MLTLEISGNSLGCPLLRRKGLLMLLTLGGCGLAGPAHGPPSPDAAAAVTMGFESFSPATVTVRPGDTVEWQNTSLITHTVTDDPKLAAKAADASLPPDIPPFSSGDIAAGQIYLHRFSEPGTYRYFCTHHEAGGMLGTVIVKAGS